MVTEQPGLLFWNLTGVTTSICPDLAERLDNKQFLNNKGTWSVLIIIQYIKSNSYVACSVNEFLFTPQGGAMWATPTELCQQAERKQGSFEFTDKHKHIVIAAYDVN